MRWYLLILIHLLTHGCTSHSHSAAHWHLILWWTSEMLLGSAHIHLLLLLMNHLLLIWVDRHITHLVIHHVHILLDHLLTRRHSHHLLLESWLTSLVHLRLATHLVVRIAVSLGCETLHAWLHLAHHHLLLHLSMLLLLLLRGVSAQ